MEKLAELPLTGDQVVCLSHEPPLQNFTSPGMPHAAQLARQWCTNCHVIGSRPAGAVPQGPPSFPAISRSRTAANQLSAFLSHPHGAMPDLALTVSRSMI